MSEPEESPEVMKTWENLKCPFTHEELLERAKELSMHTQNLVQEEATKKEIISEIGGRIAKHRAHMNLLSVQISNGYEMRQIECEVWLNRPERGTKTVVRLDTGEIVRESPMTAAERQMMLPFEKAEQPQTEEQPGEQPEGQDEMPFEAPEEGSKE